MILIDKIENIFKAFSEGFLKFALQINYASYINFSISKYATVKYSLRHYIYLFPSISISSIINSCYRQNKIVEYHFHI